MKKILLIDADSRYPNIALMKLASFYKAQGFHVDLKKLGFDFYSINKDKVCINAKGYEKVFVSILFSTNKHKIVILNCFDVEYGGTGRDIVKKLPQEIDDFKEDYSIYDDVKMKYKDCSYGFITRGCPNNCSFCYVPKKEGKLYRYREIDEIVQHEKVRFYDNNILASPEWKEIFQELIDKKIRCAFSQGMDIRLLTEEKAQYIRKLKYLDYYYFAFDRIQDLPIMEEKIKIIHKYFPKWKVRFYVYCHPDMDVEKDLMKRINWCRDNECLVFLMRDIACVTSERRKFFIKLAKYCFTIAAYRKIKFEEYKYGL